MSLERSKNANKILNVIIEKGPKTLYEIHKETGMRHSSIHLALNILRDQNLIILDVEESEKRNRNQRVHSVTFKGLVVYLSKYELPEYKVPGKGFRIGEPHETDEEAKSKLVEKLKRDEDDYRSKVDSFKEILQKNGELLGYPLFSHCFSFEKKPTYIPAIYQSFIKIAKGVLKESSSKYFALSGDILRNEKREFEKNVKWAKELCKYGKFRSVTHSSADEEGEEEIDPIALEKQKLEFAKTNLNIVSRSENELLRESFFMHFLNWYRGYTHMEFRFPNRDLCDYTKMLIEKERVRYDFTKKLLDKWVSIFDKP
jgi:hypothetical protein